MKITIRPEEQATRSDDQHTTAPTLLASVLKHLLYDGSLNKFEAARKLGDWSLHSTISNLANNHGVPIERTPEKLPHARQSVVRYSITESARNRAVHVLAKLSRRKKNGGITGQLCFAGSAPAKPVDLAIHSLLRV